MAETKQRPAYTDHTVWDDESGERTFIDGHVRPERRAIAAANHWARECGLVNLADVKGFPVADVSVSYSWFRPDPQSPLDDETRAWCDETHPEAEAVTVVSW